MQPVGARRPDPQHEVDLRVGALLDHPAPIRCAAGRAAARPDLPASATKSCGASRSARASAEGRARSSPARARVAQPAGAPARARAIPAAPCGDGRTQRARARRRRGRRPGRCAAAARGPTGRWAPGGRPSATPCAPRATVAGDLREDGGHAVAAVPRRRGEAGPPPRAGPSRRRARARRAPRSTSARPSPRRRRAGWRRPWRPRVERAVVELDGVGEVQGRVRGADRARRAEAARASGRSRRRAGGATRAARYSDRTPSPPPTSRTVSAGSSSAARSITARMLSSIRKFWPSSRFGRTSKRRRRLRLPWRGSSSVVSLTTRRGARRSRRRCASRSP